MDIKALLSVYRNLHLQDPSPIQTFQKHWLIKPCNAPVKGYLQFTDEDTEAQKRLSELLKGT